MPIALLSVYDKTGLVEFAKGLQSLGWTLLASGKTALCLQAAQLPVTEIADYTQSPELLGGRVKTLHPAIHAGLLAGATAADQQELTQFGWRPIELVAVNLYPFAMTITRPGATLEDALAHIDIGGVALIRASAKNYQYVILASEPKDYPNLLGQLRTTGVDLATRRCLAATGFRHVSQYDMVIADYLAQVERPSNSPALAPVETDASLWSLILYCSDTPLRYGENPHQSAQLYTFYPGQGPLGGQLIQGKPLSYNNLLDLDAAWQTVSSFTDTTLCIVKHLSPCGIASAEHLIDAFQAAWACDPVSAFGSIIASNRPVDALVAQALEGKFIECIIAPRFTPEALCLLAKRPQCRLLMLETANTFPPYELRSIQGGVLKQTLDSGDPPPTRWKVVSQRHPTAAEEQALQFAWKACQHVKSNAIVLAQGRATVGIGSGQPNRIDCLHIAAQRAQKNSQGAVLASDAFFPFVDVLEAAADYGIKAIIQPGGSKRDVEVIAAADRLNIALLLTGVRHLRH